MNEKNDPYAHLPDAVHPFKNFTPRQNPPKPDIPPQNPTETAITSEDIAKLEQMSREDLIALVRRCAWPQWAIGMLTKAEIADRMMHNLAVKGCDQNSRDMQTSIQQWMDREKGRPVTPVAAQIQVTEVKTIDKRELARKIDFLMAMSEHEGNGVDMPVLAP